MTCLRPSTAKSDVSSLSYRERESHKPERWFVTQQVKPHFKWQFAMRSYHQHTSPSIQNALILSSKNPDQALLSHQEDFLCQEWWPSNSGRWWWQFPSRARGRNSQACASAMRPSLPMAPWRRQNRTAIPWKVCHYSPASPLSQLFKTCRTTSLIELLTNAEQCLPAASAKMAGYLQELDGQLSSATVRMF